MARYQAVNLAYLPNKKIIFIILFILIIFAGWFYVSAHKSKQEEYIANKDNNALAVVVDKTSQYDADTDADGLKDWEEALWKTDPKKADTDGDGTNDNEEITLGRDPLKAGPNDTISDKEDLVAQEKALADSKQNTMTAIYARKFMNDYLMLKTQKGTLEDSDKKQLVDSFMSNIKPLEVEDKYKLSSLKTTQDELEEAIKKYADEMKKLFIDDHHTFIDDNAMFKVLLKKLKEKDSDYGEEVLGLNYSASMYSWLAGQMFLITTPASLAKEHIEATNGFNNMAVGLAGMALVPSDSVMAMAGFKLQEEQIKRANSAIKNIQTFFSKYGIFVF